MRVVVVGASLGGLRAAEALRRAGYTGELAVVGAEPHLPYNRPPLSKEVLAGTALAHEAVAFPLRAAVADVEWRLGTAAVAADLAAHTVTLADGAVLAWDGLVIATGLRPRRLHVPGPGPLGAGRHALRTLDDAAALRPALVPGARVVVLGAGFIGCEVAATARQLGCEVVCVAVDAYPMIRPLGERLGAQMQRRHEQHGVQFRLGVGVTELVGDDRVRAVRLATGEELAADAVVEAIGSVCNVEWLDGNGLDLRDGVRCDNALRLIGADGRPVDGVHAVGDVARFPNPLFDDVPRRVEHWNIPTETGRRTGAVLGAYLSGEGYAYAASTPFAPMPAFWSDQYDLRLQSFGAPGIADRSDVLEGDLDDEVVMGYYRGDTLVGVVGIGMLARVMDYRTRIGARAT